jgi:hypothetical protein
MGIARCRWREGLLQNFPTVLKGPVRSGRAFAPGIHLCEPALSGIVLQHTDLYGKDIHPPRGRGRGRLPGGDVRNADKAAVGFMPEFDREGEAPGSALIESVSGEIEAVLQTCRDGEGPSFPVNATASTPQAA